MSNYVKSLKTILNDDSNSNKVVENKLKNGIYNNIKSTFILNNNNNDLSKNYLKSLSRTIYNGQHSKFKTFNKLLK